MDKILTVTNRINKIGVLVGGTLLFLTAFLIAIEVILRKVFSMSMGGSDEISGYVLAISTSWAFGYTLLHKAHIRIDMVYAKLGNGIRAGLDIFALLVFLVYLTPLVYFASLVLQTSVLRHSKANTPLQTPLWIPQSLWVAGLIVFTLTVIVLLVAAVLKLVQKDYAGARQLIGPATLEEEIEEESGIVMTEKVEAAK